MERGGERGGEAVGERGEKDSVDGDRRERVGRSVEERLAEEVVVVDNDVSPAVSSHSRQGGGAGVPNNHTAPPSVPTTTRRAFLFRFFLFPSPLSPSTEVEGNVTRTAARAVTFPLVSLSQLGRASFGCTSASRTEGKSNEVESCSGVTATAAAAGVDVAAGRFDDDASLSSSPSCLAKHQGSLARSSLSNTSSHSSCASPYPLSALLVERGGGATALRDRLRCSGWRRVAAEGRGEEMMGELLCDGGARDGEDVNVALRCCIVSNVEV